jgi:hypothetical protein
MNGPSAAGLDPVRAGSPAAAGAQLRVLLGAALAAAYLGLVAWAYRDYAMDDAYIGFRYIANLLAGQGFVFEPGGRVEGVTNTGWLLLLAVPSVLLDPAVAAKLLSSALLGLTLWLVFLVARRTAGQASALASLPAVAVILAATSPDLVAFAMLGMETALLAALLAAMVLLSLDRPRLPMLATLGAFAFLVHPEAVLVLPLALAIAVATRALPPREAARCMAQFLALIALATAARWAYFGAVLPNTFLAKPGGAIKFFAHALAYATDGYANLAQPFTNVFALAAAGLGYAALRRASPLAAAFALAAFLIGVLFSLYAMPDWTDRGRYFAPYAPVALLLLALGSFDIARRLSASARSCALAATALVTFVALPGLVQTFHMVSPAARLSYPGYVMTGSTLIEPALWMRDNLTPDATVATRRVGALGYFAERRIFDYTFGLNDRKVATLIRARGKPFDDPHDAALAPLWRSRAPDYLLEDGAVMDKIARGARGSFVVHGIEYRVVRSFAVGRDAEWTLAERVTARSAAP